MIQSILDGQNQFLPYKYKQICVIHDFSLTYGLHSSQTCMTLFRLWEIKLCMWPEQTNEFTLDQVFTFMGLKSTPEEVWVIRLLFILNASYASWKTHEVTKWDQVTCEANYFIDFLFIWSSLKMETKFAISLWYN